MAIPSFSAFHDEGINLEGLLEILSPENNLVLADDMMVSDGNGIILRVSETYEKNFGFAHDSIVGKSAFDLEADGTFTPCITAEVIRRRLQRAADGDEKFLPLPDLFSMHTHPMNFAVLQLILAVLLIVLGLNIVFHSFKAYKNAEHNSEAKV